MDNGDVENPNKLNLQIEYKIIYNSSWVEVACKYVKICQILVSYKNEKESNLGILCLNITSLCCINKPSMLNKIHPRIGVIPGLLIGIRICHSSSLVSVFPMFGIS